MANVSTDLNDDALEEIRRGFDVEGAYGYTADHAPMSIGRRPTPGPLLRSRLSGSGFTESGTTSTRV